MADDRLLQLVASLPDEKRERLARLLAPSPAVAIVGMGCRFPGADGPDALWHLLRSGEHAVRDVALARRGDGDPGATAPGAAGSWSAGLLGDVAGFDAAFFGIAPREAACMDPQQRLLLEVAWEALEDAGLPPDGLAGSATGVFVGIAQLDYSALQTAHPELACFHTITGSAPSFAANRLSHVLDLRGPSVALNTACSSALVAIHLACQSLRAGECDLAIVGGVNLILSPATTIMLADGGALAPDGRLKAFDASANGFVRGEGCGVLVLERQARAADHGHPVLAVIRGSAVNQDGRTNVVTAPSGLAQQAVIERALLAGGLEASQVSYVEAHGTGTALGDPIELEALASVLGAPAPGGRRCAIGSVKANLGHLEAAAGIAGVIKVLLALREGALPPQAHFTRLTPHVTLEGTRLFVPTRLEPWAAGDAPRVAGVSSFGIGGTNAHVLIEEAPARTPSACAAAIATDASHLLPLSARSPAALRALALRHAERLEAADAPALPDVCRAASLGRMHQEYRLAVVGREPAELAARLRAFAAGDEDAGATGEVFGGERAKVVFAFPGQGGQWPGMGRALAAEEPVFRAELGRCAEAIAAETGIDVLAELARGDAEARLVTATAVAQPAIFAVQVALAAQWRAWGIEPDAVVGQSLGEVAAACVAGVLELEDAVRVICTRSRLVTRAEGRGAMAFVELGATEADALVAETPGVWVAAYTGPRSTLLAGDRAALHAVLDELGGRGVYRRLVKVDYASHGPHMDPLLPDLEVALADVRPRRALVPFASTVTGRIESGEACGGAYWARNLREPVRLWPVLQRLLGDDHRVLLEVSPHPVLVPGLRAGLPPRTLALESLRRDQGRDALLHSLAFLHVSGQPVAWRALHPGPRARVSIPTYPWQRERHWIDAPRAPARASQHGGGHPLLGEPREVADAQGKRVWERVLDTTRPDYLADHRVHDAIVVLGMVYVELALAAGAAAAGRDVSLRDVEFLRAMFLPETGAPRIQTIWSPQAAGRGRVEIWSRGTESRDWTLHARADVESVAGGELAGSEPPAVVQARCEEPLAGADYYALLEEVGARYGPALRGIERVWVGSDGSEALAEVRLPDDIVADLGRHRVHPAVLDASAQVFLAPIVVGRQVEELHLPVGARAIRVHGAVGARFWSHARLVVRERGRVEGDVRLLDDAGRVAAEIEGLRVQSVEQAILAHATLPLERWLYGLRWVAEGTPSAGRAEPRRWLVLADGHGVGTATAAALEARGEPCTLVRQSTGAAPAEADRLDGRDAAAVRRIVAASAPTGVVYCWPLDLPAAPSDLDALEDAQARGCGSLLHLVQALVEDNTPARLWVASAGAQAVAPDEAPVPTQAPPWGLTRVVRHEQPGLAPTLVDLDPAATPREQASALVTELTTGDAGDEVAWRAGRRHVARLVHGSDVPGVAPALEASGAPTMRPDASYLITGGLGGLGLETAAWLVERGARELILVGRRGAAGTRERDGVRALEAAGATVRVEAVDATHPRAIGTLVAGAAARGRPVRGVVHAAAVLDDATLPRLTWDRFARVLAPKVAGAWVLHEALAGQELDFFVMFSSAAALLGSPGQANYAAGNAFLDALAARRRAQGLPGLSIAWGAWADVGQAAEASRAERLAAHGVGAITAAEGRLALARLLPVGAGHVAAMALDLATWAAHHPRAAAFPVTRPLVASATRATAGRRPLRDELSALGTGSARRGRLETHVREQIAAVLRLDPAQVHPRQPLGSLGFDSLTALELRNRLEASLELTLSATLIWGYPTLEALVPYLAEQMGVPLDGEGPDDERGDGVDAREAIAAVLEAAARLAPAQPDDSPVHATLEEAANE